MRRLLPISTVLAVLVAAAPAQGIVGSLGDTPITTAPWQVAVLRNNGATPLSAQYCGGTILNSTHIITAAHCMYDDLSGRTTLPAEVKVLAGTNFLRSDNTAYTAPAEQVQVAGVSFDPRYDTYTSAFDSAILSLQTPLDLTSNTKDPIALAGATPAVGTSTLVSGWGLEAYQTPQKPQFLQRTSVPLVDDGVCDADYRALIGGVPGIGIAQSYMVCAGDTNNGGEDSCQGDSGGPLANTSGTPTLVGIVSFGVNCGLAAFPGVYTEVANGDIQSFITSNPPTAPAGGTTPTISGTAEVGGTLTCNPTGAWPAGTTFEYAWFTVTGYTDGWPDEQPLTGYSADNTYVARSTDFNTNVECRARGKGAGGYESPYSATVTIAAAPAPAPPPPPPPVVTPPPTDTTAPIARVTRSSCTRTTCTLTIGVTDSGFSTGVKPPLVKLRTRYTSKCRKNGRRVSCTKTRTRSLTPQLLGAGQYYLRVLRLPAGSTNTFTLTAVDIAGNRQAVPTTKTLKTRKPATKKRR